VLLVIGSQNSSNSQRLREVSAAAGVPAYLVNDETEIKSEWLEHAEVVGITAGASAPEEIVFRVLNYLRSLGTPYVEGLEAVDEHIHFALPPELAQSAHSS
jgi:4-hydroxy-3-methylbut-2-en-1-yl diphosphate reductase